MRLIAPDRLRRRLPPRLDGRVGRTVPASAAVAGALLLAAAIAAVRSAWLVVDVQGDSMLPTLRDGDRVLATRARRRIGTGTVVVARRPELAAAVRREPTPGQAPVPVNRDAPLIVKRVAALPGGRAPDGSIVPRGHLFLLGDGTASHDSRVFGPLPTDRVVGVVVRILRAPVRRG